MTKEFKLGKHYGWSVHAQRIYDETYDRVYRQEMNRREVSVRNGWITGGMVKPRTWYEAEAQDLATNMAGDAVDNYLDTPDK